MKNFKRECPTCKIEIRYKSEGSYKNAIIKNSVCRSCASTGDKNPMYGKTGDKNPFFNKKHSEETRSKQSKIKLGKKHSSNTIEKMKLLFSGDNNPMAGKTIHSVWVKKYGVEIADEKLLLTKKKISDRNSGEGNPMYGKQSPTGSGNGWSGWYKDWYFRSLRELTYMIKVIERFNLKWETGESNKYKISYLDYKGNKRNYYPDFIICGKYIVESKPKKLWNSDGVKRKKEAAIKYCNENSFIYKLVDVGVLTNNEIKKLYENNLIKFLPRYENKFQNLFF
jgi:hypothetical protein